MSGYQTINLSRGLVAIVDPADFDTLSEWKWSAVKSKGRFYAARSDEFGRMILMHRQIDGTPKGFVVDHKNNDGLDNRRENLRRCSQRENMLNTGAHRDKKTSRYKGVWWHRLRQKWCAEFRGTKLGLFENEEDAARAYDAAAYLSSPEFSRLNFPESV